MNILFMCVANSARSQMAEGFARVLFPDAEIKSAGSVPGKLNPFAVKAMTEVGVDISDHRSKSVDDLSPRFVVGIDYIITLCAEEVCPAMVAQKAERLHWPIPDPATQQAFPDEEMLKRFRMARNAIHDQLMKFKNEIQK